MKRSELLCACCVVFACHFDVECKVEKLKNGINEIEKVLNIMNSNSQEDKIDEARVEKIIKRLVQQLSIKNNTITIKKRYKELAEQHEYESPGVLIYVPGTACVPGKAKREPVVFMGVKWKNFPEQTKKGGKRTKDHETLDGLIAHTRKNKDYTHTERQLIVAFIDSELKNCALKKSNVDGNLYVYVPKNPCFYSNVINAEQPCTTFYRLLATEYSNLTIKVYYSDEDIPKEAYEYKCPTWNKDVFIKGSSLKDEYKLKAIANIDANLLINRAIQGYNLMNAGELNQYKICAVNIKNIKD